jgi:hypothetical protein
LYYFRHLRDLWRRWWQRRKEAKENREKLEETKNEIVLELEQTYTKDLEESLEKVYFKLVKANAKNQMTK